MWKFEERTGRGERERKEEKGDGEAFYRRPKTERKTELSPTA